MKSHACAVAMVASKSLSGRRGRLSQASVRSTTHRRGNCSKPRMAPAIARGLRTSDFSPHVAPRWLVPTASEPQPTGIAQFISKRPLRDYWTVQRANSLGFLDREPIDPRRAAESCHIAAIGDSFVEAAEVPIADKFHVRLEALAARTLPDLDITTSAWGIQETGQIGQIPFYDAYARRMKPNVLALVFYHNDFRSNAPLYMALRWGTDPDRYPQPTAVQLEDGAMILRPPVEGGELVADVFAKSPRLRPHFRIVKWLDARHPPRRLQPTKADRTRQRELRIERLRRRPHFAWILPPDGSAEMREWTASPFLPLSRPDVREYYVGPTAFGIGAFKERADRNGAALVILAFWPPGNPKRGKDWPYRDWTYKTLNAMAEERGVPVIDMHDYIRRQGGDVRESRFAHDIHWNATGHRWAAEALLEWLARNRHVCGAGGGGAVDERPTPGQAASARLRRPSGLDAAPTRRPGGPHRTASMS